MRPQALIAGMGLGLAALCAVPTTAFMVPQKSLGKALARQSLQQLAQAREQRGPCRYVE